MKFPNPRRKCCKRDRGLSAECEFSDLWRASRCAVVTSHNLGKIQAV